MLWLFVSWLKVCSTCYIIGWKRFLASVLVSFIPPTCHWKIILGCWALRRRRSRLILSHAYMMFFVSNIGWEIFNFAATMIVSLIAIAVPKLDKLIVFDLNELTIGHKTILIIIFGGRVSLIRCKVIIIISITIITCFNRWVFRRSLEIILKRLRVGIHSSDGFILIAKSLALLLLRLEFLLSSKESIFQCFSRHWAVELACTTHEFFFL